MDTLADEIAKHNAIFQFDFVLTDDFWKAAMKGEFDVMKSIYKNNASIGLSLQQQFRDSYVQTALDWAIVQNNRDMVIWLCDREAWSFRYTVTDFHERFSDIKQKYNGRKTYHYWHAAEKNKLQDMIEMLETANGTISVNLIRAQKTALDFTVLHKNKAMAKHLLHFNAKLCTYTPEEFRTTFPDLWPLTPDGKRESELKIILTEPELIFQKTFPDLYPHLNSIFDKDKFIKDVSISFERHTNELISSITELQQREFEQMLNTEKEKHNLEIQKIDESYKKEFIKMKEEFDERWNAQLDIKKLDFLQKSVNLWTVEEVKMWIMRLCPNYEPISFVENLITGNDLITLTLEDMEKMQIPLGPKNLIYKEIDTLKDKFPNKTKYYATSNYKVIMLSTPMAKYQDEIFKKLRKFIEFYCGLKNTSEDDGLKFFNEIQQEVLEKHKSFTNVSSVCSRLWTSAKALNKMELSSMLCEVLRDDSLNAIKFAMPIIKGLCHITQSQLDNIEWPKDDLLYRGGGIPLSEIKNFKEGLKYRCPMFLATSTQRKIGEMFCHRAVQRKIDSVLYIFHLDSVSKTKCYNVNSISDHSNVANEKEFLFLPYSIFTVRFVSIKNETSVSNPHIVHLDVAKDSERESEFLPLIYWH